MKSFLNYSKLAITTFIASSVFVACSDEISETTCDAQYVANVGNITTVGQAVDLGLPSGTKWADKNVGASSPSDNGILFVWGDVTGTQKQAKTPTSYTDVTALTPVDDLFDLYKASDVKSGTICDTTNITNIVEPMMIDLTFIGDTIGLDSITRAGIDTQKMNTINNFVKNKLNQVKSANPGFLEATLTNEDFVLIIDWDGSQFIERIVNLKGDTDEKKEREKLDYYKKYQYASNSTLLIDVMGSTAVNYFSSPKADNYSEVKDQFGVVMRKDYTGGDIAETPAYSIIADADHDPAAKNWGGTWTMPSTEQVRELVEKCTWEFTGAGYKVTGPNGNSIFLPAAGYRFGDKWYGNGNAGYYATGEIFGTYHFPSMAEQVNGSKGEISGKDNMPNVMIFQHGQFANGVAVYNNLSTSYGLSIRPVTK
jgi:hypothetical protein